jgi:hypothetical protein
MIQGVNKKSVPYVLEEDRASIVDEQTVFWILPKTGHDNNLTLQRYAGASKETRKGREVNVLKMDAADRDEFTSLVEKVEKFIFSEDSPYYEDKKIHTSITDRDMLKEVARCLSADHLSEVLEVSNNISKLNEGAKKNSNS